ncbi:MAG: hypothetical protein RBG1_1C00001G1863 [candidate division Zixibacteria bacterium RBG-1]|nr:MAG: hypothetical protein RBG1_1C00001G1863 [candidate division Zixibacteria bacterium RBG-1]OGC86001.1 MAG: hypothetical protein A2V73_04165 [candidate division Zixibacteria bacterium RBG_19FT_COMBO_42_43]
MRECKKYQELLPDYVAEELSLDTREKLDQHLVTCPGCQAELQELKSTLAILEQDKKYSELKIAEPDFLVGVRSKIEKRTRPSRIAVFRPKWMAAGLAMVLVILLGWSLFKEDITSLTNKDTANLSSGEAAEENLAETELNQLLTPETDESLDQLYIQLAKDYYQNEDLVTVLSDFSQSDFETLENKMKNINLNIK